MRNRWLGLEIFTVFILIMCRIWFWEDRQWTVWIPISIVVISWRLRRDNLKTLGIYPQMPDRAALEDIFYVSLTFWLVIFTNGIIWNPDWFERFAKISFWEKLLIMSIKYYPWALFQQLFVCGYFANRIYAATGSCQKSALGVAALFGIAHFPNPVLSIATFFGGALVAYFFLKTRNLYLMALLHAVLAPSIRLLLNYTLRVGPGFLELITTS